MCKVTARGNWNGQELTDVPVLNPGDWFGKAWLIEIGGSCRPLFLVIDGRFRIRRHRRTRRQHEVRTPNRRAG